MNITTDVLGLPYYLRDGVKLYGCNGTGDLYLNFNKSLDQFRSLIIRNDLQNFPWYFFQITDSKEDQLFNEIYKEYIYNDTE